MLCPNQLFESAIEVQEITSGYTSETKQKELKEIEAKGITERQRDRSN